MFKMGEGFFELKLIFCILITKDDNALTLSFWHHFCWMSHQPVFRSLGINLKFKDTKQITSKYVLLKYYSTSVGHQIYKYLPQLLHESLQLSLIFPGLKQWDDQSSLQWFPLANFSQLALQWYLLAGGLSVQAASVMIKECQTK